MIVCLLALLSIAQNSKAQPTRYIIKFKDKGTNPYSISNPSAYLSGRSMARRTRYHIAIDSTDLPVTPRYIDSVRLAGAVTIINVSKWLNAVSIQTTDAAALSKINSFSFVQASAPIAARMGSGNRNKFDAESSQPLSLTHREMGVASDFFDYGSSAGQVHIHNGEFLHNIGLRGQGMYIGMLDAGFFSYKTLGAFDSVRANGQIVDTWDFVNKEASVNEDAVHGMECFSTIAANIPGQFVGTAPKASFLLYRSENSSSEFPIEEHNWVCAAERVDSAGGDVISSSLGYNIFDAPLNNQSHTYADMNGNTTMAAIGADLAAKKGILVLNSAGNEGSNSWGKIVTPADGDSVVAVGAVNTSGVPGLFTSRGPSSDGQVKPDIASVGVNTVVQLPNNTIGTNNGTSFSCPNMAGLATCLWQGFPEFTNMKMLDALRRSGSRAAHPNDTIGYGIPDMKKAVMILLKDIATANGSVSNCKATIHWTSKDMSGMKYEIERKLPGQPRFIKVGEQGGTGSILGTNTYQFTDTLINAYSGTATYRIKQILDTTASAYFADYIDTVSLVLNNPCGINVPDGDITLMPNPATDYLYVRVSTTAPIPNLTIRVFTSKGELVSVLHTSKQSGTALIDIPIQLLAKAKYYVSVYNGDTRIGTKELVKL